MVEVANFIDLELPRKLKDRRYRQRFFIAETSAQIARQLIALRKRRDKSQYEVAQMLKTGQPAISRVESATYRNWSFNTLWRLAEAMDARIRVIIEPAEDVLSEYEEAQEKREKRENEASSVRAPIDALFKRVGIGPQEIPVPQTAVWKTFDDLVAADWLQDIGSYSSSVLNAGTFQNTSLATANYDHMVGIANKTVESFAGAARSTAPSVREKFLLRRIKELEQKLASSKAAHPADAGPQVPVMPQDHALLQQWTRSQL
jgi:transcriptional regulator with XRE-family HTH domain